MYWFHAQLINLKKIASACNFPLPLNIEFKRVIKIGVSSGGNIFDFRL